MPLGTLLGKQPGWRSTVRAITLIGPVAMTAIALLVPARTAADDQPTHLRHELRAFRSGQVWLSLVVTILGYGGMFGAFTYIAYTLTRVSGFPDAAVPWQLILFGVGLAGGNTLGGRAADRNVARTLVVALTLLAVVLGAFSLGAAFNVGNGRGAWIGGVTITAGLGYTSPLWAGALVTVAGLAVLLAAERRVRRTAAAPVTRQREAVPAA